MKTVHLLSFVVFSVFCSCNSGTKSDSIKVSFGIHEVINMSELPETIIKSLKLLDIHPEINPEQLVIGYVTNTDSLIFQDEESKDRYKIIKTYYPVDTDHKYYGIVAVKPNPVIDNSNIKRTKPNGKRVEIYFNMEGARKWAELTKENIGNSLAFVINNQVYTMPVIKNEIRDGVALVNGLENETFAKQLSDALN